MKKPSFAKSKWFSLVTLLIIIFPAVFLGMTFWYAIAVAIFALGVGIAGFIKKCPQFGWMWSGGAILIAVFTFYFMPF